MPHSKQKTLLVALGGNALIKKGQKGTLKEQFANLKEPIRQIAKLSKKYKIIITHGNGPQVGDLLLRQEASCDLPYLPLEILVAQTQGWLGYMIESTLDGELTRLGLDLKTPLVSLISYVVVDENDPAFESPSKPIGPILTEEQAKNAPYKVTQTAKGLRRVVASPLPLTIVEKKEIKTLIKDDFIVICCGGGGIPVIREGRGFSGVDAVIDKDLASAKLAEDVGVDLFCIATDVPGLALNYGRKNEKFLNKLTMAQANEYLRKDQFPKGSMDPKVRACLKVLENGGERAFICSTADIEKACQNKAGTEFLRE